jgi:hypothetical protein
LTGKKDAAGRAVAAKKYKQYSITLDNVSKRGERWLVTSGAHTEEILTTGTSARSMDRAAKKFDRALKSLAKK